LIRQSEGAVAKNYDRRNAWILIRGKYIELPGIALREDSGNIEGTLRERAGHLQ
jgi:hypothetical protein